MDIDFSIGDGRWELFDFVGVEFDSDGTLGGSVVDIKVGSKGAVDDVDESAKDEILGDVVDGLELVKKALVEVGKLDVESIVFLTIFRVS